MKRTVKSLVVAGLVTCLSISSCLMVFAAGSTENRTGFIQNQIGWYYQDDSGFIQNQWKEINGVWYYFNQDGYMLTGWQNLEGAWYYLGSSGVMHTGWLQLGNTWYYMDNDGVMVTGDRQIAGTDYYFNADGSMDAEKDMEKFIGTFSTAQYAGTCNGMFVEITDIEDGKVWGTYGYSYHTSGPHDIYAKAEFHGVDIKDGGIACDYIYDYIRWIWGDLDGEWDEGEGTGILQLTFVNNDNGIFENNADLNRHCSIQVNIIDGLMEIPNERLYPILVN